VSSYHRCSKCTSNHMMDGAFFSDSGGQRIVVGIERHPDPWPAARAHRYMRASAAHAAT